MNLNQTNKSIQNRVKSYSLFSSFLLHVILLLFIGPEKPLLIAQSSEIYAPSNIILFKIGNKQEKKAVESVQNKEKTIIKPEKTLKIKNFSLKKTCTLQKNHNDIKKIKRKKSSFIKPLNFEKGSAGYSNLNRNTSHLSQPYISIVRNKINQHVFYPAIAQRLKLEGYVVVSFYVDKKGNILDISLDKTSACKILNNAAFNIVKFSSPLPSPPEGFSHKIQVPFYFKITD